jgi:creatinine amidohydrolase/Fe(II)-dependent formamide hydrolase-like protein
MKYEELTYLELDALDRKNTVFLSSISPLETHGPHLPIGTDVFVALNLRGRVAARLAEKFPGIAIVYMPTLMLGADSIPVKGSVRIRYQAIHGAVLDTGLTLAKLGFKYWILTDNHGGPHHQFALEMAARELAQKEFFLIAPFNTLFRLMVAHDPDLLEKTGLGPGNCGDTEDAHGGTNETSLMLAAAPEKIRDSWKQLGAAKHSEKKLPYYLLSGIAKVLSSLGLKDAASDFRFLADGLTWVSDPKMAPYQGNPSLATKEAGEAMLNYHADLAIKFFEQALAGRPVRQKPLGWSIRALKNVM